MKDIERIVFALISRIFNRKVFLLPLTIVFLGYFLGFKTFSSYLVCNNNICQIQEKNAFGIMLSKKKLNLSNVDKFYYTNDYDWYRFFNSRKSTYSTMQHRIEDSNRFSIFVREKDGDTYPLINKTFKNEYSVNKSVNKLNDLLKQDNVNNTLKI